MCRSTNRHVDPEVWARSVHLGQFDHRGDAVAYYRELTVEIALGPKGAFENGNIGALTRRMPTDGVVTPSGFPQASDRDRMQVLAEREARLPVIEHDTCGETRTRRLA
jgi:hypothetical protein